MTYYSLKRDQSNSSVNTPKKEERLAEYSMRHISMATEDEFQRAADLPARSVPGRRLQGLIGTKKVRLGQEPGVRDCQMGRSKK